MNMSASNSRRVTTPERAPVAARDALMALLDERQGFRFTGDGAEEFAAWRSAFRRRLRGLFAPFGGVGPTPPEPPFQIVSTGTWHGCRRSEVRYVNTASGLGVPATVLEPGGNVRGAAVLCLHGHGTFGRLSVIGDRSTPEKSAEVDRYKYDYGLHLAQAGYTVLAIELLGFGERAIPPQPRRHTCDVVGCFLEVLGSNLLALQISDVRLGLSLLGGWRGVDARRVGMAGLSYGGRMTMFTAALDGRVRAAVAAGCCNTYRDRIEALSGACGAQVVPGLLNVGDTPDMFGAIAPRPLQIQWGRRDALIPAGPARRGIRQIRRCYAAAGAAERFDLRMLDGGHEFDSPAAAKWLGTHLRT